MNQFNHFLLTKFNVASFNSIFSERRLSEEYLNYRFELFDKFCYSSVKGQTNQNFKWLVLFDVETPTFFKEKIQKYAEWNVFIPIYLKTFDLEELKSIIAQKMRGQPKYLITTTLDNDDAIARDFIAIIQDNFKEQEFELLNFLHGYMWQEPNGKIYAKKNPYLEGNPCNPFISLIESSQSFKTVWVEDHYRYCLLYYYKNSKEYRADQTNLLRQMETKPAWLQVVHGTNQYN